VLRRRRGERERRRAGAWEAAQRAKLFLKSARAAL
jgi:hypothetical protein